MSKEELVNVDGLEVEPLMDGELESVTGGALADGTNVSSCTCCVPTSITHIHDV